jgi:CBS domain-containing protein
MRSAREIDYSGVPSVAGLVPVTDIMTRDVVSASPETPLRAVLELVVKSYLGCVPIVDEDNVPIGMITKRDLVEPNSAGSHVAGDAMMPLAFTLDERATVAQAAALMATEGLHHVPIVTTKGRLVGLVSSLDIVRWLARNDGVAPGA